MEHIIRKIRQIYPVSDEALQALQANMELRYYPKDTRIVQAGVHAHGDIKGLAQLLAELRGDEHSALGVDAVLILAGQSASPFRRSLKLL